jgi:hypothetical protein
MTYERSELSFKKSRFIFGLFLKIRPQEKLVLRVLILVLISLGSQNTSVYATLNGVFVSDPLT